MLIKEPCPYVTVCDKYLTVCKHKHFSDCVHLARLEVVDEVYDEYFRPLFCGSIAIPEGWTQSRKDN